jgi:hypothetical protein
MKGGLLSSLITQRSSRRSSRLFFNSKRRSSLLKLIEQIDPLGDLNLRSNENTIETLEKIVCGKYESLLNTSEIGDLEHVSIDALSKRD